MTTYSELRKLPEAEQRKIWATMTPEQRAAAKAENAAAKEAARAAEEAGRVGMSPSGVAADIISAARPDTVRMLEAAQAKETGGFQGATAGYSEEIGSALRAIPGGETPQEYRDRQRAEQARLQAEYPSEYLQGEVVGTVAPAFIPGVGFVRGAAVTPGLTARAAPGFLSTVKRGMGLGAADAALQASGRTEGGLMDRLATGAQAVPGGAILGGIAGPFAEKIAAPLLGKGWFAVKDFVTQKLGASTARAVEQNIRQIAQDSGLSVDEIVTRMQAGETLAGMNESTRVAAKAIKNKNPAAGAIMVGATGPRLEAAVGDAVTAAKTSLVGPTRAAAANLRETATTGLEGSRKAAGEALATARASSAMADPGTIAAMEEAVTRAPKVAAKANEALRANLMPPLFEKGANGEWQMIRVPTIGEADVLASEMGYFANLAYEAPGTVAKGAGPGIEAGKTVLRTNIDAAAPTLKPLREAYSAAKDAEDIGFPLGFKARSTAPDELALGFGKLADPGKDAARLGAATRIGEAVGKNRRDTSLIEEMMDPRRELARNIDEMAVTPLDRGMTSPVARARNEGLLMDKLVGESSTAGQQKALQRIETPRLPSGAVELGVDVLNGMRRAIGPRELNDEQLVEAAKILMQSGPAGRAAFEALLANQQLAGDTLEALRQAVMIASGRGAGLAGASDPSTRAGGSLIDMMVGVPQ